MTVSIDYLYETIQNNFSEGDKMRINTQGRFSISDVRLVDGFPRQIKVRISPDEYTGESSGRTRLPRNHAWRQCHNISLGGEHFIARIKEIIFADGVLLRLSVEDIVRDLSPDAQRVLKFLYEQHPGECTTAEIIDGVFDGIGGSTYTHLPPGEAELTRHDLIECRESGTDADARTYAITQHGIFFVNTDARFFVTESSQMNTRTRDEIAAIEANNPDMMYRRVEVEQ